MCRNLTTTLTFTFTPLSTHCVLTTPPHTRTRTHDTHATRSTHDMRSTHCMHARTRAQKYTNTHARTHEHSTHSTLSTHSTRSSRTHNNAHTNANARTREHPPTHAHTYTLDAFPTNGKHSTFSIYHRVVCDSNSARALLSRCEVIPQTLLYRLERTVLQEICSFEEQDSANHDWGKSGQNEGSLAKRKIRPG